MNWIKNAIDKISSFFGFKKKPLVISGVLLKLGEANLNDRMYLDNENLRSAIDDFNRRADLFGGVFGELGHPENGSLDVSLARVSHSVKDVKVDGSNVVGTITVLTTPKGKELKKILKSTVFRPRAVGKVEKDGTVNLTRIFSFDAVPKETDSFNKIQITK